MVFFEGLAKGEYIREAAQLRNGGNRMLVLQQEVPGQLHLFFNDILVGRDLVHFLEAPGKMEFGHGTIRCDLGYIADVEKAFIHVCACAL